MDVLHVIELMKTTLHTLEVGIMKENLPKEILPLRFKEDLFLISSRENTTIFVGGSWVKYEFIAKIYLFFVKGNT